MTRRIRSLAWLVPAPLIALALVALARSDASADVAGTAPEPANVAEIPRTGRPVPELAAFEEAVIALMREHAITAAAVGIMKNGQIVFERGYGWLDQDRTIPLPPNALMRIASISKPITAAAIRELIAEGRLRLDDNAFDLGQPGGGILPHEPFPELGDPRLKDITIEHLLRHAGGWDCDEAGDLTFREIAIARRMDVPSPPGRDPMLRYILGQPLQFEPGSKRVYSNVGYLVLGMIVEHVTGRDLVNYIHHRVLGPLGVRPSEHRLGRTAIDARHPREPYYDHPDLRRNVLDPDGPHVPAPYGAWHHEAFVGHGGQISTTRTLLRFLQARHINGPRIGEPRNGGESAGWRWNFQGSLPGTNAIARQRGDGVNYVILLNKRATDGPAYVGTTRASFDELMDAQKIDWPRP